MTNDHDDASSGVGQPPPQTASDSGSAPWQAAAYQQPSESIQPGGAWSPIPGAPPSAQSPYQPPSYAPAPYAATPSAGPYAPAPTAAPSSGGPIVWVPPVPVYPYTPWIRRVGAYVIDFAPAMIAMIPFWIGYVMFYVQLIQLSTRSSGLPPQQVLDELLAPAVMWMIGGSVLVLAAFGWQWYNRWLIAGRTGQSLGKRVFKMKLVAEVNGQPIGPVNAFLRDLLHVLDSAAYVGYLWPLWDAKRQTFADMIMKTVVIDAPVAAPPPPAPTAPGAPPSGAS